MTCVDKKRCGHECHLCLHTAKEDSEAQKSGCLFEKFHQGPLQINHTKSMSIYFVVEIIHIKLYIIIIILCLDGKATWLKKLVEKID